MHQCEGDRPRIIAWQLSLFVTNSSKTTLVGRNKSTTCLNSEALVSGEPPFYIPSPGSPNTNSDHISLAAKQRIAKQLVRQSPPVMPCLPHLTSGTASWPLGTGPEPECIQQQQHHRCTSLLRFPPVAGKCKTCENRA